MTAPDSTAAAITVRRWSNGEPLATGAIGRPLDIPGAGIVVINLDGNCVCEDSLFHPCPVHP